MRGCIHQLLQIQIQTLTHHTQRHLTARTDRIQIYPHELTIKKKSDDDG